MRKKTIAILALLAQATAAQAADKCAPLQQVNTIKMIRPAGSEVDLIPITIGDVQKNFLLDTGSLVTSIFRGTAEELKLPTHQGKRYLVDLAGQLSRDEASIPHFTLGLLHGENTNFMVFPDSVPVSLDESWGGFPYFNSNFTSFPDGHPPAEGAAGIYGLDLMGAYDIDVDFGTDTLNFFSPDHCPGGVLYWNATAVAVLPIYVGRNRVTVPVTVDGHDMNAIIDPSSTETLMKMTDVPLYGLTLGSPDTPEGKPLNGDAAFKTYNHTFKTLTFDTITITNPHIRIMPWSGSHSAFTAFAASPAELVIGMNVLRKLHIYMAFKEGKMYVSPASAPVPAATATPAPGSTATPTQASAP